VSILKITCHTLLVPPPELLEPLELLEPPEPLEPPESKLLLQSPPFNLLTKTTYVVRTDGIASTSIKEIPFMLVLIYLAVTLVMVAVATGTKIPTLDHAEVILIALTSVIAKLPLIAETPTTGSALLTHVVVLLEYVFPYVLNKRKVNLGYIVIL